MANITINNLSKSNWNDLLLFSDIPNIVKYSNTDVGAKASIELYANGLYQPIASEQTIIINGETIISTTDITKVSGRYFYLGSNKSLFAPSVVDALRNCPNLAASYDIRLKSSDNGDLEDKVIVEAKTNGSKYNISFDSSMQRLIKVPITYTISNGSSSDRLKDEKLAKISMQIYKYSNVDRYGNVDTYGDALNNGEYVTTLTKTYYKDEVMFDISPVLSTFAEYGKITYFRFTLGLMTTSGFEQIESAHNLYTTIGYRQHFSQPYVPERNMPCLLANVGNGIEWANLYTLYVYKPSIDLSWIGKETNAVFTIKYLDSAYNILNSNVKSLSNNNIDKHFDLNEEQLEKATYIAIQLPDNKGNLLYNIIKGIKATDKCTRLYWRNEMGGVSFMDFCGGHSKDIEIKSETYSKSNLYYYSDVEREQAIIYDKSFNEKYSVTTHIIDRLGRYLIESLASSRKVWLIDDESGTIDNVIINDVKIDRMAEYDDLYTATVEYEYSRKN